MAKRNVTRDGGVEDAATIKALWNAKRSDQASCWEGASVADDALVAKQLADCEFAIEEDDEGAPLGFGMWEGARVHAINADDELTYFRLLLAYANGVIASGHRECVAEMPARQSNKEWAWITSLRVVQFEAIGYSAITREQTVDDRVPHLYRATCAAATLRDAVVVRIAELTSGGGR